MATLDRYYQILEVTPSASPEEIKHAYRELVKRWHPDRFSHDPHLQQQAEAKFKEINEAYHTLRTQEVQPSSPSATPSKQPDISARRVAYEVFYDRGAEHAKAGRYKEALDDFSAAIRLNPNYAEAYRYRGFVHSMLGYELGAEADLTKAKLLGLGKKTPASDPQACRYQERSRREPKRRSWNPFKF